MLKYILGAGALLVIIGGALYVLETQKANTPGEPSPGSGVGAMATSTYATSTYSIIYPADYIKDEMYAYDQFGPEKLIHGVRFTIPGTMATGTNLSADTYVSVEQLPRAKNCTADIYIKKDVRANELTDNGMQYSVATSSEGAAGNAYEEIVYALKGSSPCMAVRYLLHSTDIHSYEPGTVQEFDRAALMSSFDEIRHSLQLTQPEPMMQP